MESNGIKLNQIKWNQINREMKLNQMKSTDKWNNAFFNNWIG